MKKLATYLKSKKWIFLILAALGALYAGTNFTFFNELIHAAIKVFAVAGIGTAVRSLAFPKTVGSYAFSDDLVNDLEGDKIKPRLIQYWITTVLCYVIPGLLFLLA